MAGGTWTSQNKVRPGVYIRFKSNDDYRLTIGERGVVAVCLSMSWGPYSRIMEITPDMDTTALLGYPISEIFELREMFKGTNRTGGPKKILLERAGATSDAAAAVTTGNLTATAKYKGTLGNKIKIVITANLDSTFTVDTVYDSKIMDSQIGAVVSDLTNNDWVEFTGSGALAATAGASLTGGLDGSLSSTAHSSFLSHLESKEFDIVLYSGTDSTTRAAYAAFAIRMADECGKYCQAVIDSGTANSRFVINYQGGNVVINNSSVNPIYWLAGAEAGAQYNESLTYAIYPGAEGVQVPKTNDQIINAINQGKLILTDSNSGVRIETDIDSLTTYTQDIGAVYRKNRVMRLCNSLANDIYQQFADNFIGVVTNNASGRERLKAAIVGYMIQLQRGEGIRDFSPNDVEVLPGDSIDAVVINLAFYALDAVEKIYMTVTVS